MMNLFSGALLKRGKPPGSLVYAGAQPERPVRISFMEYGPDAFIERDRVAVTETLGEIGENTVRWINVDGLHDPQVLEALGQRFGIHALVLEDIMHTTQRPRLEEAPDCLYVVLRMLTLADDEVSSEQLSLILADRCVITFQESQGDVFDPIRDRIRTGIGQVRKKGADYLLYALMDAVVDGYFMVLEKSAEWIEALEENVMQRAEPEMQAELYHLKQDVIGLRRSVWPLREVTGRLAHGEIERIVGKTLPYFRDLSDHTVRVMDALEGFRDTLSGVQELYLSRLGHQANQVMQVLTVIATIFIPLTFVAGVYGMNFDHMPELHWRYGYAGVWVIMLMIVAGMLWFFKRKRWFG